MSASARTPRFANAFEDLLSLPRRHANPIQTPLCPKGCRPRERGKIVSCPNDEAATDEARQLLDGAGQSLEVRVAAIRAAAGIDFSVKFMGLRHGGNTEGGDADLTDSQIRALSGHKTAAMTALYTKATMRQRRAGARKRLEARTKGGNLSK